MNFSIFCIFLVGNDGPGPSLQFCVESGTQIYCVGYFGPNRVGLIHIFIARGIKNGCGSDTQKWGLFRENDRVFGVPKRAGYLFSGELRLCRSVDIGPGPREGVP